MPRAYPVELRERVVSGVEEDGLSYQDAAALFRVKTASVSRWLRRAREGRLAPTEQRRGTHTLIKDEDLETLRQVVAEHREDTIEELVEQYAARTGVCVSPATMGRSLHRAGLTRKKR